ncbi:unnamed protein product [Protopolystoma xenopodis]|uniref:Uncharacterized protein n=1 Tax=Protopolystoma xenopodis TaxID=117903 RepID=A0A448X0X3_9PLAT|nr:unnamed protein product [Protopolystoma xenopodis]
MASLFDLRGHLESCLRQDLTMSQTPSAQAFRQPPLVFTGAVLFQTRNRLGSAVHPHCRRTLLPVLANRRPGTSKMSCLNALRHGHFVHSR